MRVRSILVLCLAVLVAGPGCAKRTDPVKPVVVALPPSVTAPALTGATLLQTDDPAAALAGGKADLALVPDAPPTGYESFVWRYSEQVLFQGWLDQPLALTRTEAEAKLKTAGPVESAQPRAGALARGKLTDLRPGWRPVAVDGVEPTPATVSSGKYPLAGAVWAVLRPNASDRARAVSEELRRQTQAPAVWSTLTVAGDFMLSRGVGRAMRENGTLYPIEKVRDKLAAADLTFVNLESPIGVKGTPLPGKQIWFRAAPEAIDILKAAGVDGVTVANNHILDYDTENFLETLDILDQSGIKYVGGGKNIAEARKPLVLEAHGVKVAFLGYSQFADLFFDWNYPRSFAATDTLPGVPRIQEDWLAEDIKAARARADIVAVAYHWGDEFQNYPNDMQKRLAHYTVDQGADLVLGFHPHAIQGFELYKGKFIAYSTGNFIMDRQDTDLARESMILDFALSSEGVRSVAVHPVWIRAEQPYIMTGAEGEQLLQKLRTISNWK